eukprot:3426569-Rhodomonas_salina.2
MSAPRSSNVPGAIARMPLCESSSVVRAARPRKVSREIVSEPQSCVNRRASLHCIFGRYSSSYLVGGEVVPLEVQLPEHGEVLEGASLEVRDAVEREREVGEVGEAREQLGAHRLQLVVAQVKHTHLRKPPERVVRKVVGINIALDLGRGDGEGRVHEEVPRKVQRSHSFQSAKRPVLNPKNAVFGKQECFNIRLCCQELRADLLQAIVRQVELLKIHQEFENVVIQVAEAVPRQIKRLEIGLA